MREHLYRLEKPNDAYELGIEEALAARELIKVKILETCTTSKEEIADELSQNTGAEIVQILGRTIILYRESEKELYQLP